MDCLRRVMYNLIAICGLLLLWTAHLQAEEPITVRVNDHQFAFGHQVHFSLQVSSGAPLQSIVLAYRTSDTQGTTIQTIPFDPGLSVSVVHVHDISQRYIRPFVEVTYWWTILDAAGNKLITDPQSFSYTDNRFSWQAQTLAPVTVHWYDGDAQIAFILDGSDPTSASTALSTSPVSSISNITPRAHRT